MDINKLDKNLAVNTDINEPDVVFHDVRQEPFEVYGLYDYKNDDVFKRMPEEESYKVSMPVHNLSLASAGGRVRFCTDSEYIAIDARMTSIYRGSHFTLTGGAGFDLYIDCPEFGTSRYCHTFIPPYDMKAGYTSKAKFGSRELRCFTINFPTYSRVSHLYIGIQKDATLGGGMKYLDNDPIIYYGSSITQGGCCSRPGNTYQAIVSRRLNVDFVNLGFSGNAKGEAEMAEYIAKQPMSVFVLDYDYNAPTVEHLKNTHYNFYETVRKARPQLPIVLMSKCDVDNMTPDVTAIRRDVIIDTYRRARENGDKNVYFIDGAEVYRGPYEDMCTVDKCHPNDVGFALMADAVEAQLRRIFERR